VEGAFYLAPYRMSPEELIAANRRMLRTRFALAALTIAFLATFAYVGLLAVAGITMPGWVFGLVFLISAPLAYFLYQRRSGSIFHAPTANALYAHRNVTLEPDRLVINSENGIYTQVPYSALVSAQQVFDNYFLGISPVQAIVIPRRALTQEAEQFLLSKIPKVKKV
jgi:hypothetical protein